MESAIFFPIYNLFFPIYNLFFPLIAWSSWYRYSYPSNITNNFLYLRLCTLFAQPCPYTGQLKFSQWRTLVGIKKGAQTLQEVFPIVLEAIGKAVVIAFITVVALLAPGSAAHAADWYVDGAVASSGDGTSWSTGFKTITEGINAASAGDTIIVNDGTYAEDLTISTPDLTLQSVNGTSYTTISGQTGVTIDVTGGANNFTFGGAGAGVGFTVNGDVLNTTFLFQIASGESGRWCLEHLRLL